MTNSVCYICMTILNIKFWKLQYLLNLITESPWMCLIYFRKKILTFSFTTKSWRCCYTNCQNTLFCTGMSTIFSSINYLGFLNNWFDYHFFENSRKRMTIKEFQLLFRSILENDFENVFKSSNFMTMIWNIYTYFQICWSAEKPHYYSPRTPDIGGYRGQQRNFWPSVQVARRGECTKPRKWEKIETARIIGGLTTYRRMIRSKIN